MNSKKSSGRAQRIEHLLPPKAQQVDELARKVVDSLRGYGYQLVVPPLVESTATLLDGSWDTSLARRTLQLTDPLGGQPIGIRADITPQIQQIDAMLGSADPTRLCYCGTTMYSRPLKPWENREQLQVGAELFGVAAAAAVMEIALLAANTLAQAGVRDVCLVLGSAGIVNRLLADCPAELGAELRLAVARKDMTSIAKMPLKPKQKEALARLLKLRGTLGDLRGWESQLPRAKANRDALAILRKLAGALKQAGHAVSFDIASQSGYAYHTATTFHLLSGETVLGRGGNYGTARRPACGFSLDARKLLDCAAPPAAARQVASPSRHGDPSWHAAIEKLVAKGRTIAIYASAREIPASCRQKLAKRGGRWVLERIKR